MPNKIVCNDEGTIKIFGGHKEAERIYEQQTYTIRNIKGSPSDRRKKSYKMEIRST